MVARVNTVSFQGIDVKPVDVQVQISNGLPAFTIVGSIKPILIALIMNIFIFATASAESFVFDDERYNLSVYENTDRMYEYAVNHLIAAFNKYDYIDGQFESCSEVINLPVGVAKGNHSYGGICKLNSGSEKIKFMICADEMVGHSVIKFGTGIYSVDRLAKFVALNCYGG